MESWMAPDRERLELLDRWREALPDFTVFELSG